MISRRHLIGGSAAAVLLPGLAWGQAGTTRARLPWSSFKAGPHYGAFRDAIAQMRRNQDPNDPGSMLFWANAHQFHCPHGVDHFLAWHRAYLALFERQLQTLSGISDLALPYWDYYSNPRIPAEFTQGPAATNPLAHPRRGLNVGAALSLAPFAAAVTRFPNRERDSFEYEVEDRPHNMVHSLIGRDMVTMQSPRDPIFWLHHANIDRLWSAWAGAGGGRAMPDAGDSYWSGDFHYGGGLAAPKAATRDTHSAFGYRYQNETMPILLPTTAPPRPPFKRFDPDFPIRLRPNFFAVGPSTSLELGAQDFSISIPVATSLRSRMGALMSDGAGAAPGGVRSVSVVLDGVTLTGAGAEGGYFYNVYVNLPAAPGAAEERHLVGSVTPFEIAVAQRHAGHSGAEQAPVRLVFPATETLRNLEGSNLDQVTVSFVRVEGDDPPAGVLIRVRDFRVEGSWSAVE